MSKENLSSEEENPALNKGAVMCLLPTDEILKKICYKYLSEVFMDGTKVNRFDADISEYWLPHIDYDVIPRMIRELKGNDT
jgi:hypothetical protein